MGSNPSAAPSAAARSLDTLTASSYATGWVTATEGFDALASCPSSLGLIPWADRRRQPAVVDRHDRFRQAHRVVSLVGDIDGGSADRGRDFAQQRVQRLLGS